MIYNVHRLLLTFVELSRLVSGRIALYLHTDHNVALVQSIILGIAVEVAQEEERGEVGCHGLCYPYHDPCDS